MGVGVLDHFNIRTRNLGETVKFYEDVLGLTKGPRPDFDFPGAWMYSEGRAVVHLVDIAPTAEAQKPDSGVVHHVAFVSRGFAEMKRGLAAKGVWFDTREVPGGRSGRFSCATPTESWSSSITIRPRNGSETQTAPSWRAPRRGRWLGSPAQ